MLQVALSTTGAFAGEEVVVYDTGAGYGPVETGAGHTITFDATQARYVRHWCGGSTDNDSVHFVEAAFYTTTLADTLLRPLSLFHLLCTRRLLLLPLLDVCQKCRLVSIKPAHADVPFLRCGVGRSFGGSGGTRSARSSRRRR